MSGIADTGMLDALFQIELGSVLGPILGGVITLLVAVVVSRHEAKRQEQNRRENWYRQLHNTLVRIKGSRKINQLVVDESDLVEYAHLYNAFGNQIEELLPEAPDEVGLSLFNAVQNIQISCIRYTQEVDTASPYRPYLDNRHETLVDFTLIALYVIEEKKSPDIEYISKLNDEEFEMAEEKYQKFSDGTLYDEENEEIEELMDMIEQQ